MFNKGNKPKNDKTCGDGSCLVGRHDQKNAVTLHSVFSQGEYLISIFYNVLEEESQLLSKIEGIDYNLHISLNPLIEKEDRFNCDAGRLPSDLNTLMDSEGFLKYSDWIYADFLAKKQITKILIDKPSVIRITTIEPSGIDVDLVFKNSFGILAESNAIGGAEGILEETKPGEYFLEVSFVNSFVEDTRHKFCETVLIEIGVSPQSAIKNIAKNYFLNECESSESELKELFSQFEATLESTNVNVVPTTKFFTLPIESVSIGEEGIFLGNFKIPRLVYGYFEIYSDFIIGDLSISLEKIVNKESKIIKGVNNALNLGYHGRRTIHGELSEGEYNFVIKTGPTSKTISSTNEDLKYTKKDSDYKILPHCVPFQLRIQLVKVTEKILNKWKCNGSDIKFLPKSLNTIDQLGIKNFPQKDLPTAVYFSPMSKAPNSHKNVTDTLYFFLETESIIRIIAESQESPMIIELTQGVEKIAADGSSFIRTPFTYSISAVLSQHVSYKLEVFYYPKNDQCHLYSLLIEIIPKERIQKSEACLENSPKEDFIVERLLEFSEIFELIGEDGYSTVLIEPSFQYSQNSKGYKISLPLKISSETALITGHIMSSFIKSGLVIEIENEGVVIE